MCPQLKKYNFMADSEKTFGQNIVSALSSAATSAIGGLPSMAFNVGSSILNNYLAERSAQKQYDRQLDFWEKQNEYNSPLNQRKRLQQAGLNPVAAAGDIGGHNTAGSLSSVPGNQHSQNGVIDPNALGNNMMLFEQMESIGANTDLLKRQVELSFIQEYILNAEAYGLDLSNEEKKKLLGYIDREKELSFEKVIAEIDNIKSSTALNEANTATVDALRDHLVEVQKATADSLKASADLAREQCNKTKEETEKLSDEDKKRTWDVTIGQFFGLADISVLAPELQAKAAEYYWDFQQGKYTYESTISAFQQQIDRYVEKNGHIVQSNSVNHSMGIKIGPISGNASAGKSGTY